MPDTIGQAYARALEWADDLWCHSRTFPQAQRHAPDRVRANQVLHDRFDSLWLKAKRDESQKQSALKALLDWWVDLGIMLEDCQGINRVDPKASSRPQDQSDQGNRQMVLELV